jgi:thiol-disulfide isomerase/thioredoxin
MIQKNSRRITNTQKLFFLLFTFSFLLFSCKRFNGYKISGSVKNADHVKVYLEDLSQEQPVIIDTVTIQNEKFQLSNYSEKGIYRLRFGNDVKDVIFLYVQDKDNIKVKADLKDLHQYTIEGSKPSAHIQNIMGEARKYYTVLDTLFIRQKNAPDSQKDSLQTIFTNNKKALVEHIKNFVEKEENNDVACFALNLLGPMMDEEIPYLVDITSRLHEADPHSKYIDIWYKSMQQYRDAIMDETQGGIALGDEAPNIALPTPAGDTVQLKNLQGSYVLLDFWASWCGPCRHENPNVVRIYNKFHALGFEVFSVSLDADKGQWTKAIAKDGLVWKNHVCDFGGWQSAPAQVYRVKSIPATFLLNKKGKVIAKDLRGEELEQKLDQLLSAQVKK